MYVSRIPLRQVTAANAQFGPLYEHVWRDAMQWETTRTWKWRFALLPFSLPADGGRRWVWLEWYKALPGPEYTQVDVAPFAE